MMMVMAVFMTWNLYGLQALSELELYGVVGDAGAVLLTVVAVFQASTSFVLCSVVEH